MYDDVAPPAAKHPAVLLATRLTGSMLLVEAAAAQVLLAPVVPLPDEPTSWAIRETGAACTTCAGCAGDGDAMGAPDQFGIGDLTWR